MFESIATFRERLDQSQIYDWSMRVCLVAYGLFLLVFDVVAFLDQALARPSALTAPTFGVYMTVLARIYQWMFIALYAVLPIFRFRAIKKSDALLGRLAPFAAIALSPTFLLLERAPPNVIGNFISVAASLVASAIAVVTLSFLGRSFSLMPEARRLVTDGPYKIVRHPLYFCEITIVFAMFVQYRSWIAAALFIAISAVEVIRARYEETVLLRAFEDYSAYRRQTNFIVPSNPFLILRMFIDDRVVLLRLMLATLCALGLLGLMMALPKML